MRHRDQLAFDGALDQRILDLQRDERRPALEQRAGLGLRHLPRRRVREADVAHLAARARGRRGRASSPRSACAGPSSASSRDRCSRSAGAGVTARRRRRWTCGRRRRRWGRRDRGSTGTWWRARRGRAGPPCAPSRSPMIASEWPLVYALAVSMKLPPRSRKASMMPRDSATRRAPAPVFAEGHRAEAQGADAESGPAEGEIVIEWHGTEF